jgi:AraC family transcriptional regulator of adaptative response/methylated-DNA-[protein]-cysteine methyltransferase
MREQQKWWAAVLQRDGNFDGRFVYAVRSTGIYCRPTCPSRRPARPQVVFFPGAGAAELAGFRACRRCRPEERTSGQSRLVGLVRDACRFIEQNYAEGVDLLALSARFNVSASHLQRMFKRTLGVSPAQYANACRMNSVKTILRNGSDVTSAIYEAGFGSSSRLYERTPSEFGMTPAVYGRGGKGMRIRYTTANCALGRLLVAATDRGLCAVTLGNSDQELTAALKAEYVDAEILRDKTALTDAVHRLIEHLNGSEPHLDFPLDIRATAFQRRVWDELRRIPYGATRSYSEIAKGIGRPKAARAVARACGTNPVALVIPCHRVVARNGNLSGYRWGNERKHRLLEKEKRVAGKP